MSAEVLLQRVVAQSRRSYTEPMGILSWPAEIPRNIAWTTYGLLSLSGTVWEEKLSSQSKILLTQLEVIHLFEYIAEGEKLLMKLVLKHIHRPEVAKYSDFLHLFLAEENAHMYQFNRFLASYGTRFGASPPLVGVSSPIPEAETFLDFAKIFIVEEICDFFNEEMAKNFESPGIIRELSRYHHLEEARHVAVGKAMLFDLWRQVSSTVNVQIIRRISSYLDRFMQHILSELYNAEVYRAAGIADPYAFRQALIVDPGRKPIHQSILAGARAPFQEMGLDIRANSSTDGAPANAGI